MKLSQAIREGAKLRPKGVNEYVSCVEYWDGAKDFFSCALGAAFEGSHPEGSKVVESLLDEGNHEEMNLFIESYVTLHFDLDRQVKVPDLIVYWDEGERKNVWYLKDIITTLNDNTTLSREEIADLLERKYSL